MSIRFTDNNEEKEIEKIITRNGDNIDYIYMKTNNGYERVFTATREIECDPNIIDIAYKNIEQSNGDLKNYRIYGTEGNVGNLRPSLVAATDFTNGYHVATDGTIGEHGRRVATLTPIDVSAINTIYVNSGINTLSNPVIIYSLFSDDTFIERSLVNGIETAINTEGANKLYLSFGGESKVTTANLNNVYVMDNDKMYVIPVTVEGKNLLQNTASSQTKNGVTFTVNNDGSVTCNGTASNNTFFKIGDLLLVSQSYILTGCPSDGGNDSYALRCYKNGNIKGEDIGNGFNINESIDGYIEIRIASGYTCDNLTFYPMIRKVSIEDDTYEPYHEPITTNIYLNKPLRKIGTKADYIDFKEQKVYRAIREKTITGTNNGYGMYWEMLSNGIFRVSHTPFSHLPMTINGYSYAETKSDMNSNDLSFYYTHQEDGIDIWGNWLTIHDNRYNNLEDFKSYLDSEPLVVYYSENYYNTSINLPTINTIEGTNVLNINSNIQPSNIYIKGKVKDISTWQYTCSQESYVEFVNAVKNAMAIEEEQLSDFCYYYNTAYIQTMIYDSGNYKRSKSLMESGNILNNTGAYAYTTSMVNILTIALNNSINSLTKLDLETVDSLIEEGRVLRHDGAYDESYRIVLSDVVNEAEKIRHGYTYQAEINDIVELLEITISDVKSHPVQ